MKHILEYYTWVAVNEATIIPSKVSSGISLMQGLIDRGFTPEQSAGIVGNMYQESKFDHTIDNTGGSKAFGLIQWTDTGGRRSSMLKSAGKTYKTRKETTVDNQLDFLKTELTSTYTDVTTGKPTTYEKTQWNNAVSAIAKGVTRAKQKVSNTPEGWAEVFDEYSVRSGGSNLSVRKAAATEIYAEYNKIKAATNVPTIGAESTPEPVEPTPEPIGRLPLLPIEPLK
jgi:hypothetical protein